MRRHLVILAFVLALPDGCAGPSPGRPLGPGTEPDTAVPADAPTAEGRALPPPPPSEICVALAAPGRIHREAVVRVIEGGLGLWLRGVQVDARKDERRRFTGWIVRALYPGDPCFVGLDLRPGDVVTRVNGRPIERDSQAFDVFVALRAAPAIVVDYERSGQPRRLQVDIVEP